MFSKANYKSTRNLGKISFIRNSIGRKIDFDLATGAMYFSVFLDHLDYMACTFFIFLNLQTLMKFALSIAPIAANAQQQPQVPWPLGGETAPTNRK